MTNDTWREFLGEVITNSAVITDLPLPPAFVVVQVFNAGPTAMVALDSVPLDGTAEAATRAFDHMTSTDHLNHARADQTPVLAVALYAVSEIQYLYAETSPSSPITVRHFTCTMIRQRYWEADDAA